MKKAAVITALVFGMAATTVVLAQGPSCRERPDQKGPRQGGMDKLLQNPDVVEKLGLNDEQVKKLEDLRYETEKASIQLKADLEAKGLEMRRLVREGATNEEAIMTLIDEQSGLRAQMQKTHVKAMLQGRAILGEEAAAKMRELGRERMKGQRGDREGKRGDRPNRRDGRKGSGSKRGDADDSSDDSSERP